MRTLQTMTDANLTIRQIGFAQFMRRMNGGTHCRQTGADCGANLSFIDGRVEHWKWVYPKVASGIGTGVRRGKCRITNESRLRCDNSRTIERRFGGKKQKLKVNSCADFGVPSHFGLFTRSEHDNVTGFLEIFCVARRTMVVAKLINANGDHTPRDQSKERAMLCDRGLGKNY